MKDRLKNKHVLIDTCFLSNTFLYPEKFLFFWDFLTEINCIPCINEFIYLEFIRIARTKTENQEISRFLQDKFFNLPTDPKIYEYAKIIYPLYNFCGDIKNKKQVSVADAINVCYLKKHGNNLLLFTLDNNDYPLEILDRIDVGAIDLEKQVITWGIYQFNHFKFDKLLTFYNSK